MNQPTIQDLELDLNLPCLATEKSDSPLAFSSLSHAGCVVSHLRKIKDLTGNVVYNGSDFASAFDNLRFLIRNCPTLTCLVIAILHRRPNVEAPVNLGEILPAPNNPAMFMNFTKLELYDINFAQQQTALLKHINAQKIITLEINKCHNIAPLLRGIAEIFSVGISALRFLEVAISYFTTESDEDIYSIETLLKSCLGLEVLRARADEPGPPITT